MKNYVLLLIMAVSLISCESFNFRTEIEHRYEESTNPNSIYIFDEEHNTLPDSCDYIGKLRVSLNEANTYMWGVLPSIKKFISQLNDEVKKVGGNLLYIEKNPNTSSKVFLAGKIYRMKEIETSNYTMLNIKQLLNKPETDPLEGIYEADYIDEKDKCIEFTAKYGILKNSDSSYTMYYLDGFQNAEEPFGFIEMGELWKPGNIKAFLEKTNKKNLYKAKCYESNKFLNENAMLSYDNGNLRLSYSNNKSLMRKIYPDTANYECPVSSLSGFVIDNNRIITCNHGFTDNEYKIYVKGLNGNFDTKYEAVLEKADKANDIAVLKLKDTTLALNKNLFSASTDNKSVAEEVFVIGYPMSFYLGEDLKLTNGIISATSGYNGNMNYYQITAPVQPGNSGSPLFDKNGNLIGMINSGVSAADNVGYGLKYEYLKKFLDANKYQFNTESTDYYKSYTLAEKVSKLQNAVVLIEKVDTNRPNMKVRNKPRR